MASTSQNVCAGFPTWLEEVAASEGVELQPWQRQIAEAFAEGVSVTVHASPTQQDAKQWLYDNLRRYLNELDALPPEQQGN